MQVLFFGIFWAFSNPRKFWAYTLFGSWLVLAYYAINQYIELVSLV